MLKVLDLFSGIGGFSLGLERTGGFETVAFCEIEKYPQKVLAKHWPGVPIYEDVRELTRKQLDTDGITGIDVITGGFPCQDISFAGKQKGFSGERSSLYTEMLRIISEFRPSHAVFENVSALIIGEQGRLFAKFLYDLAEIGYDCEWHCLRAARVGLPQSRDRVWIMAYPEGINGGEGRLSFKNIIRGTQTQFRGLLGMGRGYKEIGEWEKSCQPRMVRNINGIPHGMDRLKGLGNAVVPQIPELIGYAILEVENAKNRSAA